jgi:Cd2+/Zn2+-exporting ATPase
MIVGAIRGLFHREVNVDELVAIAIIVSVIFKEYLSAGFVAFMMLFGKVLEDFTAERAKTALGDLGQLTPLTACVRRDGEESEIPLNQVVAGDLVIARSGERIAVDGVVEGGHGTGSPAPETLRREKGGDADRGQPGSSETRRGIGGHRRVAGEAAPIPKG